MYRDCTNLEEGFEQDALQHGVRPGDVGARLLWDLVHDEHHDVNLLEVG